MSGFDAVVVRVMLVSGLLYLWEFEDTVDWAETFACFSSQTV